MVHRMRRNFSGAFSARGLRHGAWTLLRSGPQEAAVYVCGADFDAPLAFKSATLFDLGIEWRRGSALITLLADDKVQTVTAKDAFVHEPLPQLYDALPLASFDAAAQRFWRRVFLLVKLPGGGFLLKLLSRSKRSAS